MRTAILLAQAQLRRGWRSLVGMSLLIVLLGGMSSMVVAVLMMASVAGLIPVRRGLRHRPAQILRSE